MSISPPLRGKSTAQAYRDERRPGAQTEHQHEQGAVPCTILNQGTGDGEVDHAAGQQPVQQPCKEEPLRRRAAKVTGHGGTQRSDGGARRTGEVEIIAGLEEGQQVVTDGLVRMRDGIKVVVKAPAPAPAAPAG